MKKVLKPNEVYLADNGRRICIKCAGMNALYTGRDISGQSVFPMSTLTDEEIRGYYKRGDIITCEDKCTSIVL